MKNEPYMSNRSTDELRTLLESRNDPTINQYLAKLDAEAEDREITPEMLRNRHLVPILECLSLLQREADALETFAGDRVYLEPADLRVIADHIDEARRELENQIDEVIGAHRGEENPDYIYYLRNDLEEKAKEAAKAAKAKADARA